MSISRETFDPTKQYRTVRFHQDRQLLDSELNEAQEILYEDARQFRQRFMADGAIDEGLDCSAGSGPGEVAVAMGALWCEGRVFALPAQTLDFDLSGSVFTHGIWLEALLNTVTINEDPTLKNIQTNEPTAERELWVVTLRTSDPEGESLPEQGIRRVSAQVYQVEFDSGTGMFLSATPTQSVTQIGFDRLVGHLDTSAVGPICITSQGKFAAFPFWADCTDFIIGSIAVDEIPIDGPQLRADYSNRFPGGHGREPNWLPLCAVKNDGRRLYGVGKISNDYDLLWYGPQLNSTVEQLLVGPPWATRALPIPLSNTDINNFYSATMFTVGTTTINFHRPAPVFTDTALVATVINASTSMISNANYTNTLCSDGYFQLQINAMLSSPVLFASTHNLSAMTTGVLKVAGVNGPPDVPNIGIDQISYINGIFGNHAGEAERFTISHLGCWAIGVNMDCLYGGM